MDSKRNFLQLCAVVAVLLVVVDMAIFPGGLPRDLPWLGWKASHDKYIYAITPHVRPPAEVFTVCLLGSSLVQKGVHAATVEQVLSAQLGRPCKVYNYGVGGAYMCDILLALHRALAIDPDLVVLGTSWRDYPDDQRIDPKETATYELLFNAAYDLPDYMLLADMEERADYGLKKVWNLFRYRHWIKMNMGALANAIAEPGREKNPILFQHRGQVDWAAVAGRIGTAYRADNRRYPNRQSQCLEKAVAVSAQVRAKLSVVSMPRSSLWFKMDPGSQQADSQDLLRSVTEPGEGLFLDASRLYGDEYFIDSRHLNREGAILFSQWLARGIAEYVAVEDRPLQIHEYASLGGQAENAQCVACPQDGGRGAHALF
jgi:hypothetical protein